MEYYKTLKPDLYDWITGETTIADAIYTETERKKYFPLLSDNCFEKVNVSKNDTYFFFGSRFASRIKIPVLPYMEVKSALKKRGANTRFFNKTWYKTFIECIEKGAAVPSHCIDNEKYKVGNVTLFRYMIPVYESDFYNKNSTGYCEFLEVYRDEK